MKLAKVCAGATLLLAALSGCSSNASDSPPDVSPTARPTERATEPSVTPSSASPAWRKKFTAKQLETYEAALHRWQEYTEKTNEIYAQGQDTPEAREVFREYSMQWQGDLSVLAATYDQGGVRKLRPQIALSWKAVTIKEKVVVISQCTDYSDLVVTQRGKPVKGTKPDHLITPLVVEMDKPDGRDWMVADVELRDQRSCAR